MILNTLLFTSIKATTVKLYSIFLGTYQELYLILEKYYRWHHDLWHLTCQYYVSIGVCICSAQDKCVPEEIRPLPVFWLKKFFFIIYFLISLLEVNVILVIINPKLN